MSTDPWLMIVGLAGLIGILFLVLKSGRGGG